MKVHPTIKEVFDHLWLNGFNIELNESCCSSIQSNHSEDEPNKWIRAVAENDDQMMDDINGEGSAEVSWYFGPQDKISTLAETIVSAFTKKGYIVNWKKRMGGKITAVIEIDDLPISFLNKWDGNITETDSIEERIDPGSEVFFDKKDEERSIFSSSSDEEEDEEDSKSEPLIDPSSEEDPKSESSSEEDEDTVCLEGCECVNCEAERND